MQTRTIEALRARGVTQTVGGFPCGNCLEACVATLVGVPLDAVPEARDTFVPCPIRPDLGERALALRWPAISRWLLYRFGLVPWSGEGPFKAHVPPGGPPVFFIGTGPSPRGKFFHAVVFAATGEGAPKLVWDPYPTRAGLAGPIKEWTVLVSPG